MSLKYFPPISYMVFTAWTIFIAFVLWGQDREAAATMQESEYLSASPYDLAEVFTWLLFESIVFLFFIAFGHATARKLVLKYSISLVLFFFLFVFYLSYSLQSQSVYHRVHMFWIIGVMVYIVFMIITGFIMMGRAKGYPTNT